MIANNQHQVPDMVQRSMSSAIALMRKDVVVAVQRNQHVLMQNFETLDRAANATHFSN